MHGQEGVGSDFFSYLAAAAPIRESRERAANFISAAVEELEELEAQQVDVGPHQFGVFVCLF